MSDLEITENNIPAAKAAAENAAVRALEIIGGKIEGYAKKLCPVDTGNLRNSITHRVNGHVSASASLSGGGAQAVGNVLVRSGSPMLKLGGGSGETYVEVGTNVEYAPYIELGTGKHYSPPPEWMEAQGKRGKGRDKWFYKDDGGKWHVGYPQRARPFLRPAIENHRSEYENIIKKEFEDTNV